jgi:hypothetical protein
LKYLKEGDKDMSKKKDGGQISEETNYISANSQGSLTYYKVQEYERGGDSITSTMENPEYFSRLEIDGNANAVISWKHGQGEGSIELPSGLVYDITALMGVLNAHCVGAHSEQQSVFKELVTTLGGTNT